MMFRCFRGCFYANCCFGQREALPAAIVFFEAVFKFDNLLVFYGVKYQYFEHQNTVKADFN
jgi:hypothetical protein